MDSPTLENLLIPSGLSLRGSVNLSAHDLAALSLPEKIDAPRVLALVGNIGSSFWPVFSRSTEYLDGLADPLDRWSRRIAEQIALETGAIALYPFSGPPYLPFQQWSKRAEALSQSPLGLMIHPQYGLWHAYRFALLLRSTDETPKPRQVESPCVSCNDQPCLNTCPVEAFSQDSYAVQVCADYLKDQQGANCHTQGCIARHACPVGADYRYLPAQTAFHLQAFLATR
jgi:ferredoxin